MANSAKAKGTKKGKDKDTATDPKFNLSKRYVETAKMK